MVVGSSSHDTTKDSPPVFSGTTRLPAAVRLAGEGIKGWSIKKPFHN